MQEEELFNKTSKIFLKDVLVLDNPANFFNPLQFKLTFDCVKDLKEDLQWKIIYVGSSETEIYDQVLDTVYVGPIYEGQHTFVFQAEPPDCTKLPEKEVVGVTIVLLECLYRQQELIRIGFFIKNEYTDPELRVNPPEKPLFEKLTRRIIASEPRITYFKINWDDSFPIILPLPFGVAEFGQLESAMENIDDENENKDQQSTSDDCDQNTSDDCDQSTSDDCDQNTSDDCDQNTSDDQEQYSSDDCKGK